MERLLKIELLKILSYNTFIILFGLTIGFYILFLLAGTQINLNIDQFDLKAFLRFPTVWQSVSYYSSWFFPLLSLVVILILGNEFNFRTLRQNIIDGLTRTEFFYGKLLIIVLISLLVTILLFVSAIIIGISFTGLSINFNVAGLKYIFSFFIQTIAYLTFALLISLLVKSVGASIVVFIGYFIFELIIRAYLSIFSLNFANYLPAKVFANLTPATSLSTIIADENIKLMIEKNTQLNTELSFNANLIVAFIYLIIFVLLSYQIIKNKDL
ncbi:MAG: hypothetical protein JXR51_13170 [Bacteroidales bacterium]|nr:hypothetical protein [Bacteroidales bacterium]MBN2758122.1 hypothetical protein [Bacteroidales bacterium]